jgi:hypothetical protein
MSVSYYEESFWPDYGEPRKDSKFLCIHGCRERCRECLISWGIQQTNAQEERKVLKEEIE